MTSPEGWTHFRGSAKGWLTLRRLRRVRFWRSDRPARLPFLILFAVEFPVKHGQDGDHGDQRTDATSEDGDAHGVPKRATLDDHGDHTHGRPPVVRKMGVMRRAPAS